MKKLNYLHISIAVGVIITGLFFMQTYSANYWHNKHRHLQGQIEIIGASYKEYTEQSLKDKERLQEEREKEYNKREEARAEVLRLEGQLARYSEELRVVKEYIAEMSPDELTVGINEFIDDEATLIASGNISLTQRGGVLTLSIFEEKVSGDKAIRSRNRMLIEKDELILSLENNVISYRNESKINKDGWDKADELYEKVSEDNRALQKALSAQRWKSFGTGAVTIAVAVAIIRLSGVLK